MNREIHLCPHFSRASSLTSKSQIYQPHISNLDFFQTHRASSLTSFFSYFGGCNYHSTSKLATGLAANENPLGVILSGILTSAMHHCCCTWRKRLTSQIYEKIIALLGGVLFNFTLTMILGGHNLNQSLPCCNGIDVVYKLYIMCFLFS
ncbi:hypothetical protein CXB51_026179 [Gossypium anomalum]|uniref:Uncharacterized protein n=1 Tax=Gossypium anomalum TaxID=47600 RepID=A0A8J6CNC1_9ROSI|nr:hypothetical protein CXB51_026179 [Gossypium anomalum]